MSQQTDNTWGVVSTVVGAYERIIESNTNANILIIILIILFAIPLLGIGILTNRVITPAEAAQSP